VIVASFRVECDQCGKWGVNHLARAENSAPWEPKHIRESAQTYDGFIRRGHEDLCRECANPDPTLFETPLPEVAGA
jgi:hypothetical protein